LRPPHAYQLSKSGRIVVDSRGAKILVWRAGFCSTWPQVGRAVRL